jgi:GNAT superfamily N-acetyltransferase
MAADIREARIPEELPLIHLLLREYADGLGIDLTFQSFEAEQEELPGTYMPLTGGLWLAMSDSEAAGCVAMKSFDSKTAEMKRRYVRPAFRGHGLGRRLVEFGLAAATDAGCRRVCLDTLSSMTNAVQLYQLLGFNPIEPYNEYPIRDAIFFGRELRIDRGRRKAITILDR